MSNRTSAGGVDSAVAQPEPVRYMERTRDYYAAQGYDRPYCWARFDRVPFTQLARPLSEAVVTLITTGGELHPSGWAPGERRPEKEVFSIPSWPPPEKLYTDDLSWDKQATHTDDLDSYFPMRRLYELVNEGRIGGRATRYHGVPTEYSQRRTWEHDAPEILRRCREDEVDVALLVPL